jgi:hypothetical protein
MAKKIIDTQKFLRETRNKFYEDTKNMTVQEKFDYISRNAERGKKRVNATIKKMKQKKRGIHRTSRKKRNIKIFRIFCKIQCIPRFFNFKCVGL